MAVTTVPRTRMQSDVELHQAVLDELRWDTRVDETEVGVEVDQGVVTLTGTVDSFAKKLAAQEAAHRVDGVLDVANDIQVVTPGSKPCTDTEIAHAVRQALEWDVYVPHQRIHSTVVEGFVTLEGEVPLWAQREDAERAVRNLAGIRGVRNAIVVVPPEERVDPNRVHQTILEAFERQAGPHGTRRAAHEAHYITIEVQDGVVTLRGRVRSYAQKRLVLGAASHARGVRSVEDRLQVDPYL